MAGWGVRDGSLRVLDPGLFTLLVDFGRPGSRSLGVPIGGAADRTSLALGNALVGNPSDAPALEITLTGPTLRAKASLAGVVFGAPFHLTSDCQRLTAGKTFTLRPGETLTVGTTADRMRAYLCVLGGFDAPNILGSRSALTPVRAGDTLAYTPGTIQARFVRQEWEWEQDPRTLHVIDGPQANWFETTEFMGQSFTVTPASNRMGLRLEGRPLTLPDREVVSEPVCPGSVQVARDGQCIVLGIDGQTIGGYAKIAQVIAADCDKVGQLRPGDRVRFLRVSLDEAERLYAKQEAELRSWITRLRTAEIFAPSLVNPSAPC
jgi:antagonist of KipI